jgi:hypothetical protein
LWALRTECVALHRKAAKDAKSAQRKTGDFGATAHRQRLATCTSALQRSATERCRAAPIFSRVP